MDHFQTQEYAARKNKEMCDTAKNRNWNDILLELSDGLDLVFNLAQQASLETP